MVSGSATAGRNDVEQERVFVRGQSVEQSCKALLMEVGLANVAEIPKHVPPKSPLYKPCYFKVITIIAPFFPNKPG